MTAKHTAGPWRVTTKFAVGPISHADDQSNGMVIPLADVFGENRDADARLIAAAPDYHVVTLDSLDVLKVVLEEREDATGETDEVLRDLISRIRAALAKAEGR